MRAFANGNRRSAGISLVEVLLIVTIAMTILIIGFRQYSQFRWTQNVTQAKQNITRLLQAANVYYYANCSKNLRPVIGEVPCADLVAAGAFRDLSMTKPVTLSS